MKKKGRPDGEIGNRAAATKDYDELLLGVVELLEAGRRQAARAVHSVLTTTYWLVRKRLEHEQKGRLGAPYGAELLKRLSKDLQERLGRGFSERNLEQMRQFFLLWPKSQTLSALPLAPTVVGFRRQRLRNRHLMYSQLFVCLGLTTFASCPFLT